MKVPKKVAIALLAGVSIAGIAGASAATLGGLTAGSLGSDDSIVAACDTDGIAVGYTTAYNAAVQKYQVTAVNFTTVNAACNAKVASLSLRQGATLLTTQNVASIVVTTNAFSITLTTPVEAKLVDGLSLVISG